MSRTTLRSRTVATLHLRALDRCLTLPVDADPKIWLDAEVTAAGAGANLACLPVQL